MISLVGYTGLVGSNILNQAQFDGLYNSKNIAAAYGTSPSLLIYAGMSGTKYLANRSPDKDYQAALNAIDNIKKIAPLKMVLISTVDVNSCLTGDEKQIINESQLHPYGRNRFLLEQWVKNNVKDYHIIRLGALYGCNLKKNFIFDMINRTPTRIPFELSQRIFLLNEQLAQYYEKEGDYYVLKNLNPEVKSYIESIFASLPMNSLYFTDSRAQFQFYNLKNLWLDIKKVVSQKIRVINLVTEPITAQEIYQYVYKKDFINMKDVPYAIYNLKTQYDFLFGQDNGYIMDKKSVLEDVKTFILGESNGGKPYDS